MLQRMGQRGPFLGCSGYPECKTTMNFDAEGKPVLAQQADRARLREVRQADGAARGPRGPFLACTGYPKCKNAKDVDAEGNPVKPIDTGIKCEKCGRPMAVKRGPRGPFLGCSAYPKCRSTKPVPEELKEKLKELMPPPPKKAVPAVEVTETCPECGGADEAAAGPARATSWAARKYPKCKGTREASPELLEQVGGAGDDVKRYRRLRLRCAKPQAGELLRLLLHLQPGLILLRKRLQLVEVKLPLVRDPEGHHLGRRVDLDAVFLTHGRVARASRTLAGQPAQVMPGT